MTADALPSDIAADPHEPLCLLRSPAEPPPAHEGLRTLGIEYSSRGDRVPGHVVLPDAGPPHPVVLLAHGLRGSRHAPYMAVAARWVREGAAVAAIDLPLHGERRNAKMTDRLLSSATRAIDGGRLDGVERLLWSGFARQAVTDLRRAVDALEALPEIDARRLVFVGLSLGAMLGAVFCALDARPRAAALALAGALPIGALDPSRQIGRIAPRPLLLVGADRDAVVPREATQKLYEAAGEPRAIEWFDGTHDALPGSAFKAIWHFVRPHLGLAANA